MAKWKKGKNKNIFHIVCREEDSVFKWMIKCASFKIKFSKKIDFPHVHVNFKLTLTNKLLHYGAINNTLQLLSVCSDFIAV